MPRRTMTATRLSVNVRGDSKALVPLSHLPEGLDLLTWFGGFVADVAQNSPASLVDARLEKYAGVDSLRLRGRTLEIETTLGDYGEVGDLVDVATHARKGGYDKATSTTVKTNALLVVPDKGTSALLYIERVRGGSALTKLWGLFEEEFSENLPDLVLKTESVVESEAWLESAQLEQVTVQSHHTASDKSNGKTATEVGRISHVLKPAQGDHTLPRRIYDTLRKSKIYAGELLGVSDEHDVDTVSVTMSDGSKTKTFEVENSGAPAFRLLISDHGEPALKPHQFRNRALNEAADHLERLGVAWSEGDAAGEWPDTIASQVRIDRDVEQDES